MGKRTIRDGCFESNSSSMHTVCITNNDVHVTPEELTASYDSEAYNEDETLCLWKDKLDMFGIQYGFGRSPFKVLVTFKDKLMYAMCEFLGNLYIDDPDWETIYDSFREICKEMIPGFEDFYLLTREEDIYLDDRGNEIPRKNLRYDHYDHDHGRSVYSYIGEDGKKKLANFDEENYMEQPMIGAIDHQSAGRLKSFLKSKGISLKEFLTNKKYIIVVDGDEYNRWDQYKRAGIIDKNNIVEEYRASNYVDDAEFMEWLEEQDEKTEENKEESD